MGEVRALWKAIRQPMTQWWLRRGIWWVVVLLLVILVRYARVYLIYTTNLDVLPQWDMFLLTFNPIGVLLVAGWLHAAFVCSSLVTEFYTSQGAPEPDAQKRVKLLLMWWQGIGLFAMVFLVSMISGTVGRFAWQDWSLLVSTGEWGVLIQSVSRDASWLLRDLWPAAIFCVWLIGLSLLAPNGIRWAWTFYVAYLLGRLFGSVMVMLFEMPDARLHSTTRSMYDLLSSSWWIILSAAVLALLVLSFRRNQFSLAKNITRLLLGCMVLGGVIWQVLESTESVILGWIAVAVNRIPSLMFYMPWGTDGLANAIAASVMHVPPLEHFIRNFIPPLFPFLWIGGLLALFYYVILRPRDGEEEGQLTVLTDTEGESVQGIE